MLLLSYNQVHRWQSKVDRSLIERLRAFQSPPPMAGMTMVMVMVLLGRPEFAPGIGGAGTLPSPVHSREKRGAGESLGGGSDEMSRASSATLRRRGLKDRGSNTQVKQSWVLVCVCGHSLISDHIVYLCYISCSM